MKKMNTKKVLSLISYWPPFLFSGISIKEFDLDQGYVKTQLKVSSWNQNYFGTHFGGSLFSMCDPFYMFILIHKLGGNYYIWDKATEIEFIKAIREPVFAEFRITSEQIQEVIEKTESGDKFEPQYPVTIKSESGEVVAKLNKTLYVRKKKKAR